MLGTDIHSVIVTGRPDEHVSLRLVRGPAPGGGTTETGVIELAAATRIYVRGRVESGR